MKNKLAGAFLVLAMLVSLPASTIAQEENQATLASLQEQINALLTQIQTLQAQLENAKQETASIRQELNSTIQEFRSQLRQGLTGEEVTLLQELLATDNDIYPEGLVTGFFGPLTLKAVLRFQEKYGIEAVGEVGPQTRRALNAFLKKDRKGNKISSSLLDDFDENDEGDDDSNSGPGKGLGRTKVKVCHNGNTLTIASPALNAHVAHGDTVGKCGDDEDDDDNGDDDDNNPDTTAPVISDIEAKNVSTTTAEIVWTTDEDGTSRVLFGTSTPVTNDNGIYSNDPTLEKSHSVDLSGLTASTTYYFLVSSADASGNTATSTENQFVTE